MSNQFLQRRRPRWLYLVAAGAGLIAMVAAGLIVQTALAPRPKESTAPPAAMPAPGASTAVGSGTFTPLHGSTVIGGVPVGYPHTLAGAVSAAVEYWSQIGSTLDPARAEAIGKVIADPSWPHAAAELSQGPVSARQGLGLPASGAVPQGASVVLTPVEYQVRDTSAGQAMVLLLGYYTTTMPGQASQTRIGVYPLNLHWDGTDWKALNPGTTADYSGLEAQPGSAQASADGWHPLAQ